MTEKQRTEYNTVVLAGVLHDVGKFYGRNSERIKEKKKKGESYSHPLVAIEFIEQSEVSKHLHKKEMDIDIDLLKLMVQRHHEFYTMKDELKVQVITDPQKRALAYIGSRADSFSSSERDEEDDSSEGKRTGRLYSTFALIDTSEEPKDGKFYQLQEFAPGTVFPVDKASLDKDSYSYEELEKKLDVELKTFEPRNFNELFNGLWNIFRKYLWAVPSDKRRPRSDISLFDHLSTTSAIAASMYLFHKDNPDEKEIKNNKIEKFLLVGGDLSGIQDFLFEIKQRNPRKLSKTLRGRSFLLSLLTEVSALKILDRLGLPYSARLMSSGGRFVILAPNLPEVRTELETLEVEIQEAFFREFLGKLTLTIDFDTCLSGNDLEIGKIKEKINACNRGLIEKKLKKNIHILRNGKYSGILAEPHGFNLQENKVCSFCGVYPKEEQGKDNRCRICNLSEKLGERILNKRFLLFKEPGAALYTFLGMGIDLADEYEPGILVYALHERAAPGIGIEEKYRGSIAYGIANYLPKDTKNLIEIKDSEKGHLCEVCKDRERCLDDERKIIQRGRLSFQCIAAYGAFRNEGKGVHKLAVFKADVDNLGYIVQHGFDRLEKEPDEKVASKYSVSRYTFLSRMLDAFFQHWLKDFIREKFPMIYTVYAGGDDLLLIGPWEDILTFSGEFYEHFKRFVGDNPDITLSAGISLFSPHAPVTTAVQRAESYLERSKKEEGKDALTLFDRTIKWDKLPELIEFAGFLDDKVNDDKSSMKVAFLHRLFKYRRMFMDSEKGIVEGLRFHSLMNYDMVRNIEKRDKEGKLINEDEVKQLKPLYVTGGGLKRELLRNLTVPLYIALFKNRGGK